MQIPSTRAEARRLGARHYFTGKPCLNGHIARRFTSQGSCETCEAERTRQWRETPANREKVRANNRRRDPKLRARYNAWRVQQKRLRTPTWADREALKFFEECRPAGCHTDHIIPLLGKQVSGLHIAENLQWVPDDFNLRKRNDFAPVSEASGG